MSIKLQNLYKHLIENRKHEVDGWHNAYKEFYNQVSKIRERSRGGEGLSKNDKPFLMNLLYTKDNGIASRGQSSLRKDVVESFIEKEEFISILTKLICDPNKENLENLSAIWNELSGWNNPVLVNRVAAACTLEVSTTVDSSKFNQVFERLINEEIIPSYPKDADQSWFSKNSFLMKELKKEFRQNLESGETDEFYISQLVWYLYTDMFKPFCLNKQIIKYGAPGTGKTYQARQQACLLFDTWKGEYPSNIDFSHSDYIELVQFHPSFSYEDFIEGLRPILDEDKQAQLTLQNGIFKEFCRRAGKWEVDVFNLNSSLDWGKATIKDLYPHREKLSDEHWRFIFESSDLSKRIADAIPPFFFIIDEINRAELSRVFGELMYCLEYRGAKHTIKTQYANLNSEQSGMLLTNQGYEFFIPTNIYLIGTMNTIDRSVESFDFALRRRFIWEEVTPDTGLLRFHLNQFCEKWSPLADNLGRLNDDISKEPLLGEDYQIGHAYLMNLEYATSLSVSEVRKQVWDDRIRPLLQEYLRGTGKEFDLIVSFEKSFGL